jgi:hypothetical protein
VTKLSLEYAAGFFDGEGCISISKTKGSKSRGEYKRDAFVLSVRVTQTSFPVIYSFQETFGGSVYERDYSRGAPYAEWVATHQKAVPFLEQMLPLLVVKKEQASLALDFQNNKQRNKTDEMWEKEHQAYLSMKILNTRGRSLV